MITLTWDGPASGDVGEYRIYRDGAQTLTVDGAATSYADESIRPGQRYRYEIEAVVGESVSERVALRVKAPKPPLAEARLEGAFDVRAKPSSSYGYTEEVRVQTIGWKFEPRCPSGRCRVRWRDSTYGALKTTLSRNGKAYRGSARARLNVHCGDTRIFSSVEVQIRVTQARPIGDVWRATRIRGTMERAEESQLGCVASGATFSISGRFLSNLNP